MICRSRAALRLSFAGGGTELSPYLDTYGGHVLNATINMFAYATLTARSDNKVEFVATDIGKSEVIDAAADMPLEGALKLHRGVYSRIINTYNGGKPIGMRVVTSCDAPIGSGLGASSTITVALIKAFDEFLGLGFGHYELAHLAFEVERIDLKLNGGRQDQYASAFGGFNFMEFLSNDRVIINPLRIPEWIRSELEASMLLYYTGTSRESASIIMEQTKRIEQAEDDTMNSLHRIKAYATEMKEYLLKGQIAKMAETLSKSWDEKRHTSKSISNDRIDHIYDKALAAGALGGKISGAGGGGFMMLMTDPVRRQAVVDVLKSEGGLLFPCSFSTEGAQSWRVRETRQTRHLTLADGGVRATA
jgi:D-glycero-alpha-D-manno-heptose-7-phosphate kinase